MTQIFENTPYRVDKDLIHSCYCPLCNGYWHRWEESGFDFKILNEVKIIGGGKRKHLCPNCRSSDRLRMIFSYLKSKTNIFETKERISILHIAPERQLLEIFSNQKNIDYYPCDKFNYGNQIIEADINNLYFDDYKFDYIFCNHVLEHIVTDLKAMSELYRVLKVNGKAILQIPYSVSINKTIEDLSVTDPKLKEEKFGQDDHVRIYSKKDYINKLEKVNFKVEVINPYKTSLKYNPKKIGLNPNEELFISTK